MGNFGLFRRKMRYRCACCGEMYEGSPSFAYKKPSYYFAVPEADREARIKIDSDLCHIRSDPADSGDEDIFAIRCTLDIPIKGVADPFCWGVWVSQSQTSFERYVQTYEGDQTGDASFGWLTVGMPYYNRSAGQPCLESLECDVLWAGKGKRPKVVLHESDHPLYLDQVNGIEWDTAVVIAQGFLKTAHKPEEA